MEKINGRKNNPEKSSTAKVSEYISSVFSISTISSFQDIENKHDVYRGKDCMKKFSELLKEQAMEIINIKANSRTHMKMEEFEDEYANVKNIAKLQTIVIIQVNTDVLHIVYVV